MKSVTSKVKYCYITYTCPEHGSITKSDVVYQGIGMIPYCPYCFQPLQVTYFQDDRAKINFNRRNSYNGLEEKTYGDR